MAEAFTILTLYKAIELLLLFWLLALLFKWVLTFIFGEKGARIIGFFGYFVSFQLKKFTLSKIFKLEVNECDAFQLKFSYEETERWDILFTSLVLIPMSIGLFLGTLVSTIGLLLESNLVILSIFLYIIGFIIAVNSVPSFQDVKDLTKCSARSIIIWFALATLFCAIFAAILVPFLSTLGVLIAVIGGILLTPLITYFIPPISNRMDVKEKSSLIGGTVDLDGK